MQHRFVNDHRQTGITTRHRVTDPVAFESIEEQHLVRFGYGLVMSNVPQVDATIRKDQLRRSRALFGALMPAATPAVCVPNRNSQRIQQRLDVELRHRFVGVSHHHTPDPTSDTYRLSFIAR